jgi:hypothetical protein
LINSRATLINGREGQKQGGEGHTMGTCSYCGTEFPKTRATRKYCTARCKTNACLRRKPSRIRAADVQAIYALLDDDFESADALMGRLRSILVPGREPVVVASAPAAFIPRLD